MDDPKNAAPSATATGKMTLSRRQLLGGTLGTARIC